MKSDIQIAHETKLERIENVAAKIGIDANELEHYGKYIAKLPLNLIGKQKGKLILVTAITATKAGIGKTTVSIGLALGLNKIGKKAEEDIQEGHELIPESVSESKSETESGYKYTFRNEQLLSKK